MITLADVCCKAISKPIFRYSTNSLTNSVSDYHYVEAYVVWNIFPHSHKCSKLTLHSILTDSISLVRNQYTSQKSKFKKKKKKRERIVQIRDKVILKKYDFQNDSFISSCTNFLEIRTFDVVANNEEIKWINTDRRLNFIEISFISSARSIRSCTCFKTFSRSARLSALTAIFHDDIRNYWDVFNTNRHLCIQIKATNIVYSTSLVASYANVLAVLTYPKRNSENQNFAGVTPMRTSEYFVIVTNRNMKKSNIVEHSISCLFFSFFLFAFFHRDFLNTIVDCDSYWLC